MKKKFTDYTKLFMLIPAALVLAALILNLAGHGLNLGIDFTGAALCLSTPGARNSTPRTSWTFCTTTAIPTRRWRRLLPATTALAQ